MKAVQCWGDYGEEAICTLVCVMRMLTFTGALAVQRCVPVNTDTRFLLHTLYHKRNSRKEINGKI